MIRLTLIAAALMLTHAVAWGQQQECTDCVTSHVIRDDVPSTLDEAMKICDKHTHFNHWSYGDMPGMSVDDDFREMCARIAAASRATDLAALKTFVEQNK